MSINNDFQDSKKTSEYRNKAKSTSEEALKILEDIKVTYDSIKSTKDDIIKNKADLENSKIEAEKIKSKFDEEVWNLSKLVKDLEILFEAHPDLESELIDFEDKVTNLDELNTKINTIHSSSVTRKKEIDELYYEIIWYTSKNEESGEDEKVEWLKDKLKNIYSRLELDLKNTKKDIDTYKKEKETELENLKTSSEKSYTDIKNTWEDKFTTLESRIEWLLPNALTAWLSSAYSKKKNDEIDDLTKLTKNFNIWIFLLILVSLIPFWVSIYFLFNEVKLDDVILKLPRLVLAILPLYIPIWWFTYSANKKVNLSKRLIEEYTHKEVLSKTFEWLSTQIKDLDDSDISKELKVKLLTNILEVSSENPWKLISDYNSSDHPIIDALNKSEKLSKSIEKLEKIPWLWKIADLIKNTSKKVIEKKEDAIVQAIDEVTKVN